MAAFEAVLYLLLLLGLIGSAGATTYTVGSSGCDYTTIQDAVDAASSYDTVYVWNGSYTENVDISTAHLTIEGEGRDVVTVTGASSDDYVFEVTANYTNISGVNVTGATVLGRAGIELDGVNNCIISQTAGSNNDNCILLYHASSNTLTDNIASNNAVGIMVVQSSSSNVLTNNTENTNDDWGISLGSSSNSNTLTNNTASNSILGIFITTDSNTLTNNTVSNCDTGINLCSGADHNTFTDTTANSNNDYGIWLDVSSNNNIFTNTTTNSNGIYGIWIRSSINNIFTNSIASNNTNYNYFVWASSYNNTLLDCNLDNSTSMMNDSTSQWIIKYTTSKITYYSDTTLSQLISPTNVTTTVEPTVDDYNITMDTLDDFSAITDVSTATLQLVEFNSGGHSEFNVSSAEHATVTTFNLGTFPVGQPVELTCDDVVTATVQATAAGIATFIYGGGFSSHVFETDPVGLYVYLNDTQNYTFTNDSYDAPAFTSQVTVTSTGGPACAVSIQVPLITDSTYTELGYTVTNVTGGFSVTNASGWAAINFTVTNTTTIRISPSAGTKTSNLPAVVTGIGGVTVIVYLLRRRRR